MIWTSPDIQTLYETIDATWPAAAFHHKSGWKIRDGRGGGKRVSAATLMETDADITLAETEMLALGQDRLFMIRAGEQALDDALSSKGYRVIDPVVLMTSPLTNGTSNAVADQTHATPEIAKIWHQGGIGPDRIAVMDRAADPKYFCEIENKAVAFSAIHNGICMTHAVEVLSSARRQGLGKRIMGKITDWASAKGAHTLCVITVMENTAARGLYRNLGMQEVGHYHYRIKG